MVKTNIYKIRSNKIALLLLIFVFFSCKKEETPAPTQTTISTTTTSNGTTTYNALFNCYRSYVLLNTNILGPSYTGYAYLSNSLVVNEVPGSYMDIGTVVLNGTTFKNKSQVSNYFYNDTAYNFIAPPCKWVISGSANMQAFTDSSNLVFPDFTNYTAIPTSISKSAGFSIPLTGVSNCDFINVILLGPSGSSFIGNKLLPSNVTSISYTSAELSGFTIGNATMMITFNKDNVKTINGKRVNFRYGTMYSRVSLAVTN